MQFNLEKTIALLERTPIVLPLWLHNLPDEWVMNNEGAGTWSPFDIVGHLIHGEKTDWIPRAKIILGNGNDKSFEPFNRFAQEQESEGKAMNELLAEFVDLRKNNLETLRSLKLTNADFEKTGIHPDFGAVTLAQLLSTWVVHDQTHIAQIARVMGKQYKQEVGPWVDYIPMINK